MSTQKIKAGRNDLCPCRSGLKYKKCCLTEGSLAELIVQEKNQQALRSSIQKQYGAHFVFHDQEMDIKMSEIIIDLTHDFLEYAKSRHEVKNIIATACMAWNIAMALPEDEYAKQIEKIALNRETNEAEQSFYKFLALIIERKRERYPKVERFIIKYHVSVKRNNLNIQIMSALHHEEIGL